ncbi:MAG: hypothetical protein CMJ39_03225 [Phycisphaerae bacterium]|nr:hypothetical protein [Phycisphaerae bacterium]|tara:strand:- start:795 stop:2300 length:1506 start_codon:yes stop_codon:yes gene_type:complete
MASGLSKLSPREFDYWKAQHLLQRAGFGGTPAQVLALKNLGLEDAVDSLLEFQEIEENGVTARTEGRFDDSIMRMRTPEERRQQNQARRTGNEAVLERFRNERQMRQRADRQQLAEMQQWWLGRMIESPRPLQEKMTLFLHGHFATGYRPVEDSFHMFMQNEMFRSNAVGNFKNDLARNIIRDPAMIKYLNNNQNSRQAPNENLARELMELFTLGEGRGYGEQDIKEGARALTGYTYVEDSFQFNRQRHDNGYKVIFGQRGNWDGDDFVDLIFTRPSASQFICEKLYKFFVNDTPGAAARDGRTTIRQMSQLLRKENWELKPVLRKLFMSRHFYDDANRSSIIKSPIQLVVQSVRSLRTPVRSLSRLVETCNFMGQGLFVPPSVKGWDGGRKWINTSTLFIRQNTLVYLLTGREPSSNPWDAAGGGFDARHLVDHLRDLPGRDRDLDAVSYLSRFTIGSVPEEERLALWVDYVRQRGGATDNETLVNLLALMTAAPEYQLC